MQFPLPALDKRVVYLDQNIFSILFQVQNKGRLPLRHEQLCRDLHKSVHRALLLQVAVFPHSDIHQSETIVFAEARALRDAYESVGGDTSFRSTHEIEMRQVIELALADLGSRLPNHPFGVDEILTRERNRWLDDMRIGVNADYSQFAPAIRAARDETHDSMSALIADWTILRPEFDDVLNGELEAYGRVKVSALLNCLDRHAEALAKGDIEGAFNSSMSEIMHEQRVLKSVYKRNGVSEEEALAAVVSFWRSTDPRQLPTQFIFTNLIAAVARRVAQGQRRFSRGLMNDVRAISTYAPYVDAMVLDNEMERLLAETPQLRKLKLKARFFSLSRGQELLDYLADLCATATDEMQGFAKRIYGIE